MEDEILTCVDCNDKFVFPVSERRFFIERQFVDHEGRVIAPIRCEACRAIRRRRREDFVANWQRD